MSSVVAGSVTGHFRVESCCWGCWASRRLRWAGRHGGPGGGRSACVVFDVVDRLDTRSTAD
ncbi:hypothetical protein [Amycolatopsis thermophila]|uniref:Uncharacterized protein n=1 Tax=Amycolatopsis thermophila TaxID=206084 RepID=A0ABU0F330_9PSEU|nr:hypothetical protein [Amycolatopsis thermophila]MDQ0381442.1 hypothetical protein [Amycolatopsis thermophila]